MIQIVQEGESTFPSLSFFSTAGTAETALAHTDIASATWSRKVVGTGEVVNSRDQVALSITAMPFTLEQAGADNTRVNSARRRERHEVIVEYSYTRAAVAGKTGKWRAEFLVVPVSRVVYAHLSEDARYLRKVHIGFAEADDADWDEIWDIEEDVTELVEARLGKRFYDSSNATPRLIEKIAAMLGAAEAIDVLHVGESEHVSKYAAKLREMAEDLLTKLIKHQLGVQYADGTWDADYPAPSPANNRARKGTRRNLAFDRSRPFHQQAGHKPTDDDDELMGHDDRGDRVTEYDV